MGLDKEAILRVLKSKAKDSKFPPIFQFKNPGDTLAGRIINLRKSPWNPNIMIADVETFEGEVYSTPNNAVLNRRFEESGLAVGKYVYIEYLGTVTTGKGRKAKDFKVAVLSEEEIVRELGLHKEVQRTLEPVAKAAEVKPETPQPKIPDEVVSWAKNLFSFYDEMEVERFQRYMEQRGYKYPVEEVAKAAGLKISGGKISK